MISVSSVVCDSRCDLYNTTLGGQDSKKMSQNISSGYPWVMRLCMIILPSSLASPPYLPTRESYPKYPQSPSVRIYSFRNKKQKERKGNCDTLLEKDDITLC